MKYFLLLFLLAPFTLFSQDLTYDWDDGFFFEDGAGITITGTMQTSQQISAIDREEIERREAADLASLLNDTLNLNIVRYGGFGNRAGINLRGFDSKRVAILIDGIPVNSAIDGRFDINQIDINSIERIEVIHGGSDSRFNVSGALGGVINIVTVRRQPQGWRFGGSFSNTSAMPGLHIDRQGQQQGPHWGDLADTQNISLFAAFGGESFSFSANIFANRAQNHFLFEDFLGITRRKDNNEVMDGGVSTSMVWELPNLSKLIYASSFYYADRNFPTSGFSANMNNQQDFSTRQNILLEAPRAFHDDFASELSLSWHFSRLDFADSRHDLQSAGIINRWSWFLADRLTLRSGVNYRFVFLDSTDMGNRNRHDGGISLTAEFSPHRSLLLIPSAKTVFTSGSAGNAAVIPKFGILWNVTDSLAIRNNYFRSFKFPDFEELYWADGSGAMGNPDLRPEDGWGADIGVDWRITERINMESTFFTQWLQDSIHWFSSGGIWRPENVGEAMFMGLDTRFRFEIPVEIGPIQRIIPTVSYKYLRSYLLSFGYTFASNKRIPYSPEHTIGGSLDIDWGNGSLLISGQFESLRFHDRANLVRLEPYFLLNAMVNQNVNENITIFGVLRNILNTSYESFYDYPMPGITLTLGVRFSI